jgi:hypothetical protein
MSLSKIDHRLFKTHRYGLVDASMRDEVPSSCVQVVIAPDFLENDTSRSPVLIDLSVLQQYDQDALLTELQTQCIEREATLFSLLIESEQEIDSVAKHLAQKMVVRLQHAGEASQFRYFDPGTFLQLPNILGDDGMAWLLGRVTSVSIPWAGCCSVYSKPQVSLSSAYSFALTPVHLQALLDLSAINRVASQLPAPTDQQDWIQRCESITQHIQRAKQHGLTALDDKICFALHAIQHHPRFDQHERIAQLFSTLKKSKPADELDYQELSSRISSGEWEALSQELSSSKTQ